VIDRFARFFERCFEHLGFAGTRHKKGLATGKAQCEAQPLKIASALGRDDDKTSIPGRMLTGDSRCILVIG
jgi:hypothetical protein